MTWKSISTSDHLDLVMSVSSRMPVFVFKHSTRCSISQMVLSRFERENKLTDGQFYLLDLLSYRPLSDQISSIFGVQHESPQLLIINDEKCIAHASHYAVNSIITKDFL
ncbi:MAG: bacillithiol system redox-active protein YtxJ [Bacteroidota bacterium]|nr:bacillithiol system redox-active protein YtxJ [Bacteroidota bacterium]